MFRFIVIGLACCLAVLVTLNGCQQRAAPAMSTPASQSFPVVALVYSHEIKNVDLVADYGYIIDWTPDRKPTFHVFNKPQRTRIRTSSWETFLTELRKLPDRSEIDPIAKCTAPFEYGMPAEKRDDLLRVLSEKSFQEIHWEKDRPKHTHFCTCESKAVVVLADEAR